MVRCYLQPVQTWGASRDEIQKQIAPVLVDDVIDSLRTQGIAFRGPCWTHTKPTFFVINQSILLESELIDLLEQNKLNRDGIQELAERIKAHSPQGTV